MRRRLLVGIAAVQLLAGTLATLLVLRYEHQRSYAVLEAELVERAAMVKSVIEPPDNPAENVIVHRELLTLPKNDIYVLVDSNGRTIASSGAWRPSGTLPSEARSFVNQEVKGHHYRILIQQGITLFDDDPHKMALLPKLNLFYGARVGGVEERIQGAGWIAAGLAVAILIFSLAATAWVVRSGLRPVSQLATRAARIEATNWEWEAANDEAEAEELAPLSLALTRLVDRLRVAFARERQFSSDAAHEMKTAVAIVKSTLQLALERGGGPTDYRAGITSALEDAGRMQDLVNGMLLLAKAEGIGGPQCDRTDVSDAAEQIRATLRALRPMLDARRIRVTVDSWDSPILVRVPAQGLGVVLTNLIENAIRYSPEGSAVEISAQAQAENCILSIKDEGMGIDESVLPHIFERFYRGDPSRSRESGGIGLGLSIVQAIVVSAGGSIEVESSPGMGSAFTVTLPRG